MFALVAHAAPDPLPFDVTFSRIMCSDVGLSCITRRAGLGVIFPCSSEGPWVPCVGLHFLPPPLVRPAGKGGQAEK